ncbi:MAG: hypothetical protein Q7K65_03640 [Candidatus Buchananbacteria bacterium]|nr:hypothetical protein [Candidatus Buchananbacteria bacterium]
MNIAHDLFWCLGLALIIMGITYTVRLYRESFENNLFRIPWDAIVVLTIGIIMYIISFFIPIIH